MPEPEPELLKKVADRIYGDVCIELEGAFIKVMDHLDKIVEDAPYGLALRELRDYLVVARNLQYILSALFFKARALEYLAEHPPDAWDFAIRLQGHLAELERIAGAIESYVALLKPYSPYSDRVIVQLRRAVSLLREVLDALRKS
jgi:hypothetical protein